MMLSIKRMVTALQTKRRQQKLKRGAQDFVVRFEEVMRELAKN